MLILDRIVKWVAHRIVSRAPPTWSYLCISCKFGSKRVRSFVRSFVRLSMQLFSFGSLSLFFSRSLPLSPSSLPPPKSHLIPPPPSLPPFVVYVGRGWGRTRTGRQAGREGGRASCLHRLYLVLSLLFPSSFGCLSLHSQSHNFSDAKGAVAEVA